MTKLTLWLVLFQLIVNESVAAEVEDISFQKTFLCRAKGFPIEGVYKVANFVLNNPIKSSVFVLLTFMNPVPVAASLLCNCECTYNDHVFYKISIPPPLSCDPCEEALCPYECHPYSTSTITTDQRCRELCNQMSGIINISSIQAICK